MKLDRSGGLRRNGKSKGEYEVKEDSSDWTGRGVWSNQRTNTEVDSRLEEQRVEVTKDPKVGKGGTEKEIGYLHQDLPLL